MVIEAGEQFPDGPPLGRLARSGGSVYTQWESVGAEFFAGPPQEKLAPSGGSATHEVASVGAIWEQIAPVLPDFTVEILPEIDSTNSELMRRAKAGQTQATLLVTEHQTAGRGRLGRAWLDERGAGQPSVLMFSLGLVLSPRDWSGLSLAVGLSVAQSLHPELRLKWPNDLWWQERKLAGILIETVALPGDAAHSRARYAVIGIGINILPRSGQGLATAPAWLQELLPEVNAAAALQRIAVALVGTVRQFEQTGFAPFQAPFNQRDALAGKAVGLSDGSTGIAQGVDETGALRLLGDAGVVKITSSEISVRPQGLGDKNSVPPALPV